MDPFPVFLTPVTERSPSLPRCRSSATLQIPDLQDLARMERVLLVVGQGHSLFGKIGGKLFELTAPRLAILLKEC